MAELHDAIQQYGIESARASSMTKAERQAADAAFTVLSDEGVRVAAEQKT